MRIRLMYRARGTCGDNAVTSSISGTMARVDFHGVEFAHSSAETEQRRQIRVVKPFHKHAGSRWPSATENSFDAQRYRKPVSPPRHIDKVAGSFSGFRL